MPTILRRLRDRTIAEAVAAELDEVRDRLAEWERSSEQRDEKLEAAQAATAERLAETIETLRSAAREQDERISGEVEAIRESADKLMEGHSVALEALDTRVGSNTTAVESLTKWADELAEDLESAGVELRSEVANEGARVEDGPRGDPLDHRRRVAFGAYRRRPPPRGLSRAHRASPGT